MAHGYGEGRWASNVLTPPFFFARGRFRISLLPESGIRPLLSLGSMSPKIVPGRSP